MPKGMVCFIWGNTKNLIYKEIRCNFLKQTAIDRELKN